MIGRADIEGSKSNVAMFAWLPQASYPCGNFSDTSNLMNREVKGSIGHAFTVCIHTENQNQVSFSPFGLQRDFCSLWAHLWTPALSFNRCAAPAKLPTWLCLPPRSVFTLVPKFQKEFLINGISKTTSQVVVFHRWLLSHLSYISRVVSQSQTRVKLNRVFFPRWFFQARSLGCGFAR